MEISKQEKSGSLITSLIISSPIIASFTSDYLLRNSYAGIIVMGLIWALLFRYMVIYGARFKIKALIFIAYLFLIVTVSSLVLSGHVDELALQFIEYGLLGLLVGTTKINSEDALKKCTFLLLILAVPCYMLIRTSSTNEYSNDINMGLSYGIIPLLFSVITHFFLYHKNSNIASKISYVVAFILLFVLLIKGTRGVWVCWVFLIYFIFIIKTGFRKSASTKKIVGSFIIVLAIVVLLSNFDLVLLEIADLLSKMGIDSHFLDKSLLLISKGDL